MAARGAQREVLDRDGDGRGKEVAFEIDAKVKTVSYTLDYSYEEPHLITWRYVEGDVRDVDGEFVFEDRGRRHHARHLRPAHRPRLLAAGQAW